MTTFKVIIIARVTKKHVIVTDTFASLWVAGGIIENKGWFMIRKSIMTFKKLTIRDPITT